MKLSKRQLKILRKTQQDISIYFYSVEKRMIEHTGKRLTKILNSCLREVVQDYYMSLVEIEEKSLQIKDKEITKTVHGKQRKFLKETSELLISGNILTAFYRKTGKTIEVHCFKGVYICHYNYTFRKSKTKGKKKRERKQLTRLQVFGIKYNT